MLKGFVSGVEKDIKRIPMLVGNEYKEGWEVRDNQDRLIWGREDELQTTTGTLKFKGYGLPVKVKSLLGNGVQNGTPTPDAPIMPEFCGVKTGNLIVYPYYDKSSTINDVLWTVSDDGHIKGIGTTSAGTNFFFNRNVFFKAGTYTIKIYGRHLGMALRIYDSITQTLIMIIEPSDTDSSKTFTLDSDTSSECRIYFNTGSAGRDVDIDCDIMLNSGSTALPYEPYGYKIPISSNSTTTPIYLGEVQTTRQIKKLVLTGKENWQLINRIGSVGGQYFNRSIGTQERTEFGKMLCSHYIVANPYDRLTACCVLANYSQGIDVRVNNPSTESNIDNFKAYLAAQYAAGTPVTVWYVLKEPETTIVNEPLAKIGDYADELTTIKVHGLSAPLYGIGDYKDILNLSTGVVTRNVKKLVLTGTNADGNSNITPQGIIYITPSQTLKGVGDAYCTHFRYVNQGQGANMPINSVTTSGGAGTSFWFKTEYTNVADFKSYLASQYAAGTPVTVWYVLATPTTETITVPTGMTGEIEGYLTQISTPTPEHQSIPKWNGEEETGGTYAVTVYNLPEIITTTGQNTLTIETEKIHGLTNPLCGIGDYKDVLNLSTGIITRKIKKLVLTGEEYWVKSSAYQGSFYTQIVTNLLSENYTAYCSHLTFSTLSQYAKGKFCFNGGILKNCNLWLNQFDSNTTVEELKSYLASQYAAGTPVTVWYVLSAPETETITVPYGLESSVEGYLTQSGTPTPSNPITPDSNGILESGGTYAVEVSLIPSNLTVKGHIKPI